MSEIEKAKITVLATSHQFQGPNFLLPIDDPCYREIVEHLISGHSVDYVFEEAAGRGPTYAQEIAKEQTKPVNHIDIDPSVAERKALGLAEETGASNPVDLWSSPPCVTRAEYVDPHARREEFWINRIKGTSFTSGLVICGCAHGLSLSFRLRDAGYRVENCFEYMPHEKLCGHV